MKGEPVKFPTKPSRMPQGRGMPEGGSIFSEVRGGKMGVKNSGRGTGKRDNIWNINQ